LIFVFFCFFVCFFTRFHVIFGSGFPCLSSETSQPPQKFVFSSISLSLSICSPADARRLAGVAALLSLDAVECCASLLRAEDGGVSKLPALLPHLLPLLPAPPLLALLAKFPMSAAIAGEVMARVKAGAAATVPGVTDGCYAAECAGVPQLLQSMPSPEGDAVRDALRRFASGGAAAPAAPAAGRAPGSANAAAGRAAAKPTAAAAGAPAPIAARPKAAKIQLKMDFSNFGK
jgi:hypothetical protein